MTVFNHFNFNVLDLDKSLAFYKEALNLSPVREKEAADGSFKLVYLGDEAGSPFQLELTWLRDRTQPYWANVNSILRSTPVTTTGCTKSTRPWDVSALKIPLWGSTSSPTRMATGSRLYRRRSKGNLLLVQTGLS